VRLRTALPEYRGRVWLRTRPFPLEIYGGEPPPRDILEQEWWLAALQEPTANFVPYRRDGTTLPTFQAVLSAFQLDEAAGHDFDLCVRRAFFGESRNIGRREGLLAIAREARWTCRASRRRWTASAPAPLCWSGGVSYGCGSGYAGRPR
jgi:predicted DsbA family dithiol-disulfide isomerase